MNPFVQIDMVFQSLSGLSLGLNTGNAATPLLVDNWFQSLSGLSLGLNLNRCRQRPVSTRVSIPFRAVTGFEHRNGDFNPEWMDRVSIPFRAVTGFELQTPFTPFAGWQKKFQSLSGLSLGLNVTPPFDSGRKDASFNPFQGCHWV